jgi:predicted alpha/beta superfamily hydrolase
MIGWLISLYAFFRFPAVFGFAGVMSPSLFVNFEGQALSRTGGKMGYS